jgi:hypothetical protein
MVFAYPPRATTRRANRLALGQVPQRHPDPLPHSAAFGIAGRQQFIRTLSGIELGLVALPHEKARGAPNV